MAAALTFATVVTLPMPLRPPDEPWLQGYFIAVWVLYLLASLLLLGSALCAALSVWPRRYARDPDPQRLAERYHASSEEDVLRQLIANLAANHAGNRPTLTRQLLQLKLSLLGLMLGLSLLLALVLVRGPVAP